MARQFDVSLVNELRDAFAAAANPEAASAMSAYMRGLFPFAGLQAARRRALQAVVFQQFGRPDAEQLELVAAALWALPEREYQYAACDLLRRHSAALDPAHLPRLRELVTMKSWWDTVDGLASHVIGQVVRRFPQRGEQMVLWIRDSNLWVARVAILHQLQFKQATNEERLFRYCTIQAGHPDFFIRKAIGWALREYSKTAPDAVRAFVTEQAEVLSPLSQREALRHLSRHERAPQEPA